MSLLGCILLLISTSAQAFDHSHSLWQETLGKYRSETGLVHYKQLKQDSRTIPGPFGSYLRQLEAVPTGMYDSWTESQKKAFLINAYNAFTVKLIIDHYPVKSIKKISWFRNSWKIEFFKLLGGQLQSLDPIEHDWLRPKFKDYRIHAAVNCASISCPPLRKEPFVAERLDQQLDEQMETWLKDSLRNKISAEQLELSKIFEWYREDFEQWGNGIHQVIRKHSKIEVNPKAPIKSLPYDWSLNEAP